MPLSYAVPTPLEYFAALVQGDSIALLEAAACIAHDAYPELDVQQLLGDVDQLQARLLRRIPADAGPLQRLRALNQFFYVDLAFSGNLNDYYAPDNSYLNAVLRTRRGIPIALAVLWLELAQGAGLQARGVSFPGHFLVKVLVAGGQVVLDPLTGQSLTPEELSERLEPFLQRQGMSGDGVPLGLYLKAAGARDILARMLGNLKEIHRAREDWERQIAVQNRLIVLLPDAWGEWRDRGLARAELGQSHEAVLDLQMYLTHAPLAPDVEAIAQLVSALRGTR